MPMHVVRLGRMRNKFTTIVECDGEWFIDDCPAVPGANGQGQTRAEARDSLADAITLILLDRRDDGLREVPPDAERETIFLT